MADINTSGIELALRTFLLEQERNGRIFNHVQLADILGAERSAISRVVPKKGTAKTQKIRSGTARDWYDALIRYESVNGKPKDACATRELGVYLGIFSEDKEQRDIDSNVTLYLLGSVGYVGQLHGSTLRNVMVVDVLDVVRSSTKDNIGLEKCVEKMYESLTPTTMISNFNPHNADGRIELYKK